MVSYINRSWILGRKNDLHIYGPDSLNTLVKAANDFLSVENQYRVDHPGVDIMDISKAKGIAHEYHIPQNAKEIIFQQDGITITAFDVDHEPIEPAVGYVIEYNGKKVVLNHLAPAPDNRFIKNLYMEELEAFEGPIHLANDGDVFIVDGADEVNNG